MAASKKIIWVGSLTSHKQPEIAVELSKRLHIPLEIIGEGSLRDKLEKHNYVTYKGNQKDILPFLKDARVLISTSKSEGFGMALVEALAQGIPVVSFDCPHGPAEIIQNGVNGFLVYDIEEMADRIKYVIKNDFNRNILVESVAKFHPAIIIAHYDRIMEDIYSKN